MSEITAPPLRTEGDEPALPVPTGYYEGHPGLSMREWFAGLALVGILGSATAPKPDAEYFDTRDRKMLTGAEIAARAAYQYADEMLAHSEKEN
jgi:hypothetical protein